jgi:ribulose kinase
LFQRFLQNGEHHFGSGLGRADIVSVPHHAQRQVNRRRQPQQQKRRYQRRYQKFRQAESAELAVKTALSIILVNQAFTS